MTELMALPILKQLYAIYQTEEWWHTSRLNEVDFNRYTQRLIDTGNIFYVTDGEQVVGYTEVWKITYEQFGKLLCMEPIDASDNDVQTGKIAYVANVWIDKEYRRGDVVKMMRKKYFEFTKDCAYHVGEAKRKATGLVKVFKAKQGAKYGQH